MIRCPKCERVGHLPDVLAPGARSLRCRRCKSNFLTTELAVKDGRKSVGGPDDPWRSDAPEPSRSGQLRPKTAPFLAEGHFSRFDDSTPFRKLGPGDSNYEMNFSLEDLPADSEDDWNNEPEDFLEAEEPSSDEISAVITHNRELLYLGSRFVSFLVSWGSILCFGVMGLVAVSVLLIGYILVNSPALQIPIQMLILACLGIIALLLIGIALLMQSLCLAELTDAIYRKQEPVSRLPGR